MNQWRAFGNQNSNQRHIASPSMKLCNDPSNLARKFEEIVEPLLLFGTNDSKQMKEFKCNLLVIMIASRSRSFDESMPLFIRVILFAFVVLWIALCLLTNDLILE